MLPQTASSSSSMMHLQDGERRRHQPLRPARRLPERQHFALHVAVGLRVRLRQLPHRHVDVALRLRARSRRRRACRSRCSRGSSRSSSSREPGSTAGASVAGSQKSNTSRITVPLNPRGATPTIVTSTPLTRTVCPSAAGRAAEARLPVVVRDHDHRRRAGLLDLVGAEEAAERGRQAERGEVVVGHEQAARALDAAALADVERNHPEGDQPVDRAQPLAQVAVLEPRRRRDTCPLSVRGSTRCKPRRDGDAGESA